MKNSNLQSGITYLNGVNKTIVVANGNSSVLLILNTFNSSSSNPLDDTPIDTSNLPPNSSILTENIASLNPFKFSSEYHDSALGLVYYNYRHYNFNDGRWLSRDPIAEKGCYNLYKFVQNNALILFDYLGLLQCKNECEKLLKDIEDNQTTIDRLNNAINNWKPGEILDKDYGLEFAANPLGYRSDELKKRSACYQKSVDEIENDHFLTVGCALVFTSICFVGYYTCGLHGLIHDTTAEKQMIRTFLANELFRSYLLQKKLKDAYENICK